MQSGEKGADVELRRCRTVELTSKLCVGAFIRIRKLSQR